MNIPQWKTLAFVSAILTAATLTGCNKGGGVEILNVSYDRRASCGATSTIASSPSTRKKLARR